MMKYERIRGVAERDEEQEEKLKKKSGTLQMERRKITNQKMKINITSEKKYKGIPNHTHT